MAEILRNNPPNTKLFPELLDLSPLFLGNLLSSKSVKKPLALTIENVCTSEECQQLIYLSEHGNYEKALVNVGLDQQKLMTDVRNNSRYIRDDTELAAEIWSRIEPFVPAIWNNKSVSGLNERLRFLRYDPGEKFAPHCDGCYTRPDGSEKSYVTIQLYLNEGFEGGETTFFSFGLDKKAIKVVPKTGMVLVFEHPLLHEGSAVLKGRKYVIRTDVMYKV
ncbi:hypothetical protein G9A89_022374 [Geosiphon pyriformis]|nr:hypothetical protein G9A89_022374 [Geosiphon pyriformis]